MTDAFRPITSTPLEGPLTGLLVGLLVGVALGFAFARWRGNAATARLTQALHAERVARAAGDGRVMQLIAERDQAQDQVRSAQTLAAVIDPLRENLESLRRMTIDAHDRRTQAESALSTHIEQVHARYASLEAATDQLVRALSRGQTRGQWGEMQLEQLLGHAGLLEGAHFDRQLTSADGRRRPDIVIKLPGKHQIPIDAKFPFDAYWAALSAPDPASRERAMRQHATDLLARIRELAGKGYHRDADGADIVVLFLPLESLLSSALEADGTLLEQAFRQRVVLATPTTLLALLRTVGFAYDRAQLAESTEEVRRLGGEMLQRLGILVEHLEGLRRGLAAAVSGYNAFVGSFDRQALTQARRMRDLGLTTDRSLDAPEELGLDLRAVSRHG